MPKPSDFFPATTKICFNGGGGGSDDGGGIDDGGSVFISNKPRWQVIICAVKFFLAVNFKLQIL